MNTVKSKKGIILIVVTLFIILVGAMIAEKLSNGNSFATNVTNSEDSIVDEETSEGDSSETQECSIHTEEIIPEVEPTCTTNGSTEGKKCSVCGKILEEPQEIQALGHEEVIDEAIEPTCTENGLTAGKHCSVCWDVLIVQEEIPATGHNFDNGVCTKCGQLELQIEISSEKYIIIDDYIKVQPRTTGSDFKSNIQTNADNIRIYDEEELEISDNENLVTGMSVELECGEVIKIYKIIVIGDVIGDGEADFKDIVKINQVRLNRATLDEIYCLAADVRNDEKIDFKDMVKINRFRLNKITEL